MNDLQITYRPTGDLIPYVNNAKIHEPAQIEQIAASIKEYGFNNPILLDGANGVIAGHGRLQAAQKLKLERVPTVELSHLSDSQRRAYILADNRLAEVNTSWDFDLLSSELESLQLEGMDIDLTGFDEGFILSEPDEGPAGEDEVPNVPDEPVTVMGDVWVMGEHRLMCGDSTSIDAFNTLMAGNEADFCFTSPPYNGSISIGVQANAKKFTEEAPLYRNNADDKTSEEYVKFNVDVINNLLAVSSENFTCCYNINYNRKSPSEYIDVAYMIKQAIPIVDTVTWQKSSALPVKGNNLTRAYEFIFVMSKGKYTVNKTSTDDSVRNIWKISNIGAQIGNHRACFPVALVEMGIRTFAPHRAIIVEPFAGSGTSLIAAEKTGCKAMLMELDEIYSDVAVVRWQSYTGKTATLEGDGRTFDEIKAERIAGVGTAA